MKKIYSVPELTITELSTKDVVTFSIPEIFNFEIVDKAIEIGEDQDHVVF